jgi:hypothetical protein
MVFALENQLGFGEPHTTWPGNATHAMILDHHRELNAATRMLWY